MSLIHCPHCGNTISDRASTCPKCGYDLTQGGEDGGGNNSSNKVIIAIVAAIVVVAIIGGGLYWKKQHDQQVAEQQRQEQLQREQQAEQARQQALAQAEKAKEDELWNNYETPDLKMFGLKGFVKKVVLTLQESNVDRQDGQKGVSNPEKYVFSFDTKGYIGTSSYDYGNGTIFKANINRNGQRYISKFTYLPKISEEDMMWWIIEPSYNGDGISQIKIYPDSNRFLGTMQAESTNRYYNLQYDDEHTLYSYNKDIEYGYHPGYGNGGTAVMKRTSHSVQQASDGHTVRRSVYKGTERYTYGGFENVYDETHTITLDIYYYDRSEIDLKGMLQNQ